MRGTRQSAYAKRCTKKKVDQRHSLARPTPFVGEETCRLTTHPARSGSPTEKSSVHGRKRVVRGVLQRVQQFPGTGSPVKELHARIQKDCRCMPTPEAQPIIIIRRLAAFRAGYFS